MTRKMMVPAGAVTLAAMVTWPFAARAFNPQPEPPARFGMVGLARGQTARLNLVNLIPPDPQFSSGPQLDCRVTLGFVDALGQPFVNRAGAEVVADVSLPPGHAAFLDLSAGDVFRDESTRRVQFRAGVERTEGSDDGSDPCANLAATLEIFDNQTGRTTVLYHPPDPQHPPDPGITQ